MDTTAARNLAREKMALHGLVEKGWKFKFDRAKKRAGLCSYHTKTISLSEEYVTLNGEAEVLDTILHEIAHALVGHAAGHGYEWQIMAKRIGCNAQRTTDAKITESVGRYEARCEEGGGHVVARYHRRPGKSMINSGFCRTHMRKVQWFDTATRTYLGQLVDLSTLRIAKVPAAPVAAAAKKPWESGSDWDSMFNA